MDLLNTFVFNESKHEVRLVKTGENNDETLFRASDIGKVLGIGNVRESIKNFDQTERCISPTDTAFGVKDVTFLTEEGVYRLVMRSNKPIARPFQKWVFHVIREIRKNGKYELQKEIDDLKEKHMRELEKVHKMKDDEVEDTQKLFRSYKDTEDERVHKTLVEGYDDKTVVYFGKIKTMDDDRILFKIGCTKNIKPRTTSLQHEFGNMAIFKIFECDNHESFERFLHGHLDIRRYSYKEMINGKKRSMEVFCMTQEQLDRAVNIAVRNVQQYRAAKKRDFDDLVHSNPTVRSLCEKVGIEVNEDVDSMEIDYANKRGRCTLSGPKIQAYSEDGTMLIQTYQTILDAARDMGTFGTRNGIEKACINKNVKYGFRWSRLERSSPDDTVQDIGETVPIVTIRTGHVAGLNHDKTEVMKVYTSFKACAVEHGFKSSGFIQKRMKRGEKVGEYHIMSWSEVPENIQDKWLENNTLPEIPKNARHHRVNRLDPITRKVLKTYSTMNEVYFHFKMGQNKLKKAINGDLELKGFKWAYA